MHLLTATDPRYFEHTLALLASYRAYHAGRMFVYAVGLKDQDVSELRRFGAELLTAQPTTGTSVGNFIVCTRVSALEQVLPAVSGECVLLLDADSLIRRNLDELDVLLHCRDVAICLRSGTDPDRLVYGGFLAIRGTQGAMTFLQCYQRHLAERGIAWYADQWALFRTYEDCVANASVSFAELDGTLLNRRLHRSAAIWSPSARWRRHPRFLGESSRWRRAFFAGDVGYLSTLNDDL